MLEKMGFAGKLVTLVAILAILEGAILVGYTYMVLEGKMVEVKDIIDLLLVGAGSVLLVVIFTFFAMRQFTGPMRHLVNLLSEVERDWDLTRRAMITTQDEMGRFGSVFDKMLENLSELVNRVQEAGFHVGSSSSELLAGAEEIARGASNQAKHLEDAASAVTELSAAVQQMTENAQRAAETARQGGESVERINDTMARIKKTVQEASERTQELGESSQEIEKIVGVITQISDQTQLLALNAAIEAARAGEHGRGFAVVADEVGKLAERVSQSAREIEELVNRIRERTEETVGAMTTGSREVEEGTTMVQSAGGNFLEIVDVVQETAHAVQEQSKAADEISHLMTEVLAISKETVTATEEAVGQGNQLRELALKLESLVKKFKVKAV